MKLVENIPTDKQYPKISKASSGYLEIEHFRSADLHTGYFCYNCTYFIKGNHCAVVEDMEKNLGLYLLMVYVLCGIPTRRKPVNRIVRMER
jgi:hypothetical protein